MLLSLFFKKIDNFLNVIIHSRCPLNFFYDTELTHNYLNPTITCSFGFTKASADLRSALPKLGIFKNDF